MSGKMMSLQQESGGNISRGPPRLSFLLDRYDLRIAIVTDYATGGGSSVAAARLSAGLRQLGHCIGYFYYHPPAPSSNFAHFSYPLTRGTLWIWQASMHLHNNAWRWISQKFWVREFRRALFDFRPDIIHLHNLHGANWDIEVVEECIRHAPVVWTMHDMWPLTGGCVHSFDCQKFKTKCDRKCPQAKEYPIFSNSMVASAHRRRQILYDKSPRIILAAPSDWLYRQSQTMIRGRIPLYRIGNGLDLDIFRVIPKTLARSILRLPDDETPCFLASAASLSNHNKGMHLFLQAISTLKDWRMRILLMGQDDADFQVSDNVEMVRLGLLRGDRVLPLAYAAADALIHPSLAENQPLVIMESMACGRPVVALPIGGIPEMVQNGRNGWLAASNTEDALRSAILDALRHQTEWPRYSLACREKAEREFGLHLAAKRYEALYASILNGSILTQEDLDSIKGQPIH